MSKCLETDRSVEHHIFTITTKGYENYIKTYYEIINFVPRGPERLDLMHETPMMPGGDKRSYEPSLIELAKTVGKIRYEMGILKDARW